MNGLDFEKTVSNFFENVDDLIKRTPSTKEFLNVLNTIEIRVVENAEKNTTKRLLYCLLRIISSSEKSLATKACERLLTYMKKIDLVFETFKPTMKLIQQLNFNRLLVTGDNEVVYDLMVFILRYYPEVTYEYFLMGNAGSQKLKREEVKRVWDTVHSIIKKMDILKGDMRSRSQLTAKALGEIFSYLENLKKTVNLGEGKSLGDFKSSNFSSESLDPRQVILKEELDGIKNELKKMKETIGQSQDLPKIDHEKLDRDFNSNSSSRFPRLGDKNESGIDQQNEEMANIKRKVLKNEMTIDDVDYRFKKLENEFQRKFEFMKESIESEIDSLKIVKERVKTELEVMRQMSKNQNDQLIRMQNQETKKVIDQKHSTDNNEKEYTVMLEEYRKLKIRLESLEKNFEQKQEVDVMRIQRMDERIDRVEERPKYKLEPIMEEVVPDLNDQIFAEMTLDQLSEFAHKQKKFNDMVQKSLRVQNFNDQPLKQLSPSQIRYDGKLPENYVKDMEGLKLDFEDIRSKVIMAEKDILSMSEVQKVMKEEIESLVLERASRFKSQKFKNDILNASDAKAMNEIFMKEMLSMKIQLESIFEKHNLHTDKILDLGTRLREMNSDGNNAMSSELRMLEIKFQSRLDDIENRNKLDTKSIKFEIDDAKKMIRKLKADGVNRSSTENLNLNEGGKLMRSTSSMPGNTQQIFEFIQEYVNERAMNCINLVSSDERDATFRFDRVDWVVRNTEFISPRIFDVFVQTCHKIEKMQANSPQRINFYSTKHVSNVLDSVKRLLIETQDDLASDGVKQQLPRYLQILEICHFSTSTLRESIKIDIPEILINIISNGKSIMNQSSDSSPYQLSQRCFAQCLKQQNLVIRSIDIPKFAKWISTCLENKSTTAGELQPTFEILESAFQSVAVSEIILKHNYGLVKDLIKVTKISKFDLEVLLLNIKAFRQFTVIQKFHDYINPSSLLEILIEIYNSVTNSQVRQELLASFKNLLEKDEFAGILEQNGILQLVREV